MATTTPQGNLLPLRDLRHVNTAVSIMFDENGKYRAAFSPEFFFDSVLLQTIEYGEENYVHIRFAETINIRKGESAARFKRYKGLTPTLTPLKEGVPPLFDKHSVETLEVGSIFSFGRASEYTDVIDWALRDSVKLMAERANQYGVLAGQIKELWARKTWLSSPNEFYANFRDGFDSLVFGDEILLDDLRFLIQRMKRLQVKPIGGKFNYICSPEYIQALIDDPRVKAYMMIEKTTGKMWGTGEPFDLFELSFIPTMLDEFAYPDTEFPGVYELADGKEAIRLYTRDGNTLYYINIHQDFEVKSGVNAKVLSGLEYLPDGTALENHYTWELPIDADALAGGTVQSMVSNPTPLVGKVSLGKQTVSYTFDADTGLRKAVYTPLADASGDLTAINNLIDDGAFLQLPVHRGILFGDEALVKIQVDGVSDQPKIIIQALGSAGTADPLHQRQTVGFRVDGFGLALKRTEAVAITYGIPKNAEFAALTATYVAGRPELLDFESPYDDTKPNHIANEGHQALRVDPYNIPGIYDAADAMVVGHVKFAPFSATQAYEIGDRVIYDGKPYVFVASHSAGAWDIADVVKAKAVLEDQVQKNDPKSNIK